LSCEFMTTSCPTILDRLFDSANRPKLKRLA
jgi:hypothetical protein